MSKTEIDPKSRKQLQQECAPIFFHEIERFFAKGMLILVAKDVDIIDIALILQADNTKQLQQLIKQEKVTRVHDKHAIQWSKQPTQLLAITAVPWLLVQEIID
ncbi:hypothetical protein MNBD_GAMMA01-33 [hydrothermal vent metagenome]|uniref:DUF2288 domain-containing protein n=2 Tax=hydrothermal vent metagenome TaxID=652676 RepID=A0A3B0VES3_9ZZZZ